MKKNEIITDDTSPNFSGGGITTLLPKRENGEVYR